MVETLPKARDAQEVFGLGFDDGQLAQRREGAVLDGRVPTVTGFTLLGPHEFAHEKFPIASGGGGIPGLPVDAGQLEVQQTRDVGLERPCRIRTSGNVRTQELCLCHETRWPNEFAKEGTWMCAEPCQSCARQVFDRGPRFGRCRSGRERTRTRECKRNGTLTCRWQWGGTSRKYLGWNNSLDAFSGPEPWKSPPSSRRTGLRRATFAGLPAVAGRQASEGWRRGSESDCVFR